MAQPSAGDLIPATLSVVTLPMEKTLCSKDQLTPSRLGFPSEFPYEFDTPTFSSPFTSPDDSSGTEEEGSDDEEDFLAGLTRRLAHSTQRLAPSFTIDKAEEKRQEMSTSPQSTLSGLGSWSESGSGSPNGPSSMLPSPPTTPFKDDAWDVISAAAGQVARLKLTCDGEVKPLLNRQNPYLNLIHCPHRSVLEPIHPHHGKPQNAACFSDLRFQQFYCQSNKSNQILRNECDGKQQVIADCLSQAKSSYHQSLMKLKSLEQQNPTVVSGITGCENGRCFKPAALFRSSPPLPQQRAFSSPRNVFPGGSAARRPCGGTGVFLPRRYTSSSDSRKKSGGSNVVFPSKVGHPQNLNFDEFTNLTQPRSRPCLSSGHIQFDYETLIGQSGLVGQGSMRPGPNTWLGQERHLPQDWMY